MAAVLGAVSYTHLDVYKRQEHAVIVKMGKDYYVEDVGSTNGTTVNGEEIQKHLLQHADLIELGKHQLKFINEEVLSHLGTCLLYTSRCV